jgi:hypothetical protein
MNGGLKLDNSFPGREWRNVALPHDAEILADDRIEHPAPAESRLDGELVEAIDNLGFEAHPGDIVFT